MGAQWSQQKYNYSEIKTRSLTNLYFIFIHYYYLLVGAYPPNWSRGKRRKERTLCFAGMKSKRCSNVSKVESFDGASTWKKIANDIYIYINNIQKSSYAHIFDVHIYHAHLVVRPTRRSIPMDYTLWDPLELHQSFFYIHLDFTFSIKQIIYIYICIYI